MDASRFDFLVQSFTRARSRRSVGRSLVGIALGGTVASLGIEGTAAKGCGPCKKKKDGKCKKKKPNGTACAGGTCQNGSCQPSQSSQPSKSLRQICNPSTDTCSAGLQCSTPTTRHSCSSSVQGVGSWCCVPPGGSCTECDCCGNNYCGNDSTCITNPEGP